MPLIRDPRVTRCIDSAFKNFLLNEPSKEERELNEKWRDFKRDIPSPSIEIECPEWNVLQSQHPISSAVLYFYRSYHRIPYSSAVYFHSQQRKPDRDVDCRVIFPLTDVSIALPSIMVPPRIKEKYQPGEITTSRLAVN